MKVLILWSGNEQLLAETMEQLITESQCFLFTVLCGGQKDDNVKNTAAYKWAIKNGAPVEFLIEPDLERLIARVAASADFLVAYNDGNQIVKRLIMKFKSLGKHGRVINAY